jgi:hypothetical protein
MSIDSIGSVRSPSSSSVLGSLVVKNEDDRRTTHVDLSFDLVGDSCLHGYQHWKLHSIKLDQLSTTSISPEQTASHVFHSEDFNDDLGNPTSQSSKNDWILF